MLSPLHAGENICLQRVVAPKLTDYQVRMCPSKARLRDTVLSRLHGLASSRAGELTELIVQGPRYSIAYFAQAGPALSSVNGLPPVPQ